MLLAWIAEDVGPLPKCVVKDRMQIIYDDDFDNIVIASPVYYGTLPGAVLSVMSRLQPWHVAKIFLKSTAEATTEEVRCHSHCWWKRKSEKCPTSSWRFFSYGKQKDFMSIQSVHLIQTQSLLGRIGLLWKVLQSLPNG